MKLNYSLSKTSLKYLPWNIRLVDGLTLDLSFSMAHNTPVKSLFTLYFLVQPKWYNPLSLMCFDPRFMQITCEVGRCIDNFANSSNCLISVGPMTMRFKFVAAHDFVDCKGLNLFTVIFVVGLEKKFFCSTSDQYSFYITWLFWFVGVKKNFILSLCDEFSFSVWPFKYSIIQKFIWN